MADYINLKAGRSKDNTWYLKEIGGALSPDARQLLEKYGKIPPDEVEAHIYKCRDLAWDVFPFPCIGNFWFLKLGLSQHPSYPDLLARFQSNPSLRLLDLGTCFGQDLRKLAFDGAPENGLYGTDLQAGFEAAGHALFRDTDTWQDKFIAADVLDANSELAKTEGTWDVIQIAMFLHVFSLEDCKTAVRQILKLLKPDSNSWVIGTQSGSLEPKVMELGPPWVEEGSGRTVYRHSKETFADMWKEIAGELGLKVDVWAEYLQSDSARKDARQGRSFFSADDTRRITFLIKLL